MRLSQCAVLHQASQALLLFLQHTKNLSFKAFKEQWVCMMIGSIPLQWRSPVLLHSPTSHTSSVFLHCHEIPWIQTHTQTLSGVLSDTHGKGESLNKRNQLRLRQRRHHLCHTYRRQCSLCERGHRVRLAFLSPSTNITLVLAFYSQGCAPAVETFIGRAPSSLVWFHNLPTVHKAL